MIDVEGLAGLSHSPAPRGGVRKGRGRGSGAARREVRVRAERPSRWLTSSPLLVF